MTGFTTNPEHYYSTLLALHAWFHGNPHGDQAKLEHLDQQLIDACERYFVEPAPDLKPLVADTPWDRPCSAQRCGRTALVVLITAPDRRTFACAQHAEWLLEILGQ